MAKTITGFVLYRDCAGKAVPVPGRKIYAQPERPQSLFMDGTAWAPAYRNPAITLPGFERAIECTTAANGQFSINLPQANETFVSGGGSTDWIITDPLTPISFKGPVSDVLISPIDVRDLVVAGAWQVIPSGIVSVGAANFRTGYLDFTASLGQEQDVSLVPPFSSAAYTPMAVGATDDLMDLNYSAFIIPGWTASKFTIRLSAAVPSPRTVRVPWVAFM